MGAAAPFIGPVIGGIGSIVGGRMTSNAASDASAAQTAALYRQMAIHQEAAEQGRLDLGATYTPAYMDTQAGLQAGMGLLAGGQQTTADLLTQSALASNQIYGNTSRAMQSALMGMPMDNYYGQPQTPWYTGYDIPQAYNTQRPPLGAGGAQRDIAPAGQLQMSGEGGNGGGGFSTRPTDAPQDSMIMGPGGQQPLWTQAGDGLQWWERTPEQQAAADAQIAAQYEALSNTGGSQVATGRYTGQLDTPEHPLINNPDDATLQAYGLTRGGFGSLVDEAAMSERPLEDVLNEYVASNPQAQQAHQSFQAQGSPLNRLPNSTNYYQTGPRPETGMPDSQQHVPGTGFIGAYQSLTGQAGEQLGALSSGYSQARDAFQGGMKGALGMIRAGQAKASGYSMGQVKDMLDRGTTRAVAEMQNYRDAGDQALARERAFLGLDGVEAQQQAYDNFLEAPGQKWLRERQEQALLRNQAATGQLGGGNTLTALQEQAAGIAAQQYQQELSNIRSMSTRGQNVAQMQGGFHQQSGIAGGQIAGQLEGEALRGRNQVAISNANAQTQAAIAKAQLAAQGAGQLGDYYAQEGINAGNVHGTLGSNMANLQTGIGGQLASVAGQLGAAQASNVSNLGTALGNLDQTTAVNLANMATQGGANLSNIRMNYGNALANIATQSGTQVGQTQGNIGSAEAAGIIGQNTGFQQGLSGLGNSLGQLFQTTPATPTVTNQNYNPNAYLPSGSQWSDVTPGVSGIGGR